MKPLTNKIFRIMQVVILAGGLGTRLRPLTYNVPKPMIEIKGKPFLEYLILYLKNQGLKNILILTSYLSEKIASYFKDGSSLGVLIKYSNEISPLGTGGALKNAERYLNKEFILLNGDTFIPLDYNKLIYYYKNSGRKNIIVVNKNKKSRGNIMIDRNKKVVEYNKKEKKFQYEACGVQIFKKEILRLMPKNKVISVENDIFPLEIKKTDLIAFETKADFFDLGTFERVKRFRGVINTYFRGINNERKSN